jgi:hypothetical protein
MPLCRKNQTSHSINFRQTLHRSKSSLQNTSILEQFNYLCTFCLYGAVHNGFEAGKIHYEGHWKGWTLEMGGPKKVEISRAHSFQYPE